jgi:sugar transferase (PEP-CTERM system associated)
VSGLALSAAAAVGMVSPAGLLKPALFGAAFAISATAMGLYSARQRAETAGILVRIVVAHVAAIVAISLVAFLVRWLEASPSDIYHWLPASILAVSLARVLYMHFVDEDALKRRVLIYGAGRQASSVANLRRRADQRGFLVVGFVLPDGERPLVNDDKVLRPGTRTLLEIATELQADEIVVAMDDRRREFPVSELLGCRLAGIEIVDLVSFLERETGRVRLDVLNPSWIIFSGGFKRDPVRLASKRAFDVVAAAALLTVTWPVLLLTALAIQLEDGIGSPLFYRQRRVGLDEQCFDVLKFRSMHVDAERDGRPRWASATDDRVTRVGRFIRKVRIDELPQILNVLRGDMSFVGPRPERPEFVDVLNDQIPYYRERHCVNPGITGWAQICYRYGASERDAAEKLQYDLFYIKNNSFLFDLVILLQTVEIILFGKGGR